MFLLKFPSAILLQGTFQMGYKNKDWISLTLPTQGKFHISEH